MSRPIKMIKLAENEQLNLEEGLRNHPKGEFRQRCQMLLVCC